MEGAPEKKLCFFREATGRPSNAVSVFPDFPNEARNPEFSIDLPTSFLKKKKKK